MNARPVFDTLWMAGKIEASKSSTAFGKSESSHETNAKPTKCSRITFSEWLLFKVYKAKPTMAYNGILFNGRPFHQRHCSVASGCFFLDMFMCHFSSVQRRSFRFMSPTTVDLPVVAHLQHGRKSGAGVLGACLDATEIENWLLKKVSSVKWKHVGWWSSDWVFIQEIHENCTAFQLPKWKKLRPLTSHYIAAMAISRALSGSWVAHVKMRRCEMWTVEPR